MLIIEYASRVIIFVESKKFVEVVSKGEGDGQHMATEFDSALSD